jgi:hypothetical protein
MKKTFKINIKIKNCDKIFADGLPPGSIGLKKLIYDLEESEFKHPMFVKGLLDYGKEFRDELIDIEISEE